MTQNSIQGKNSRRGTKSMDHSLTGKPTADIWRKISEPPPSTAGGFFARNILGACSSTSCNTDEETEDSGRGAKRKTGSKR